MAGEAGHGLPVGPHRGQGGGADVGLGEAVVAGRDGEAGRHAFDVVLEGPRQGLVEVVQVEQQGPLRRSEHPEVRQMGVTAQLDFQAGGRRVLQVGGHDLGRAPIERERRHHHPAMANRDQVRFPGQVLGLQERHRVGAVTGRRPSAVARQEATAPGRPCPSSGVHRHSGAPSLLRPSVCLPFNTPLPRPAVVQVERSPSDRRSSFLRRPGPGNRSRDREYFATVVETAREGGVRQHPNSHAPSAGRRPERSPLVGDRHRRWPPSLPDDFRPPPPDADSPRAERCPSTSTASPSVRGASTRLCP